MHVFVFVILLGFWLDADCFGFLGLWFCQCVICCFGVRCVCFGFWCCFVFCVVLCYLVLICWLLWWVCWFRVVLGFGMSWLELRVCAFLRVGIIYLFRFLILLFVTLVLRVLMLFSLCTYVCVCDFCWGFGWLLVVF